MIKEYKTPNGETLYKVSVVKNSTNLRGRRIRQHKSGFKTRKAAEIAEKSLLQEITLKLFKQEQAGFTLAELLERWELHARADITKTDTQKSLLSEKVRTLELHLPSCLKTPLNKIMPYDLQHMMEFMQGQGYSRNRIRAVISAFNSVAKWAELRGLVHIGWRNPSLSIKLPKSMPKNQPILTMAETKFLLAEAQRLNHPHFHLWAIAVNTGLRSGELKALKWSDLDLDRGMMTVSRSFSSRIKAEKCTKTEKTRIVPINTDVCGILKTLRAKTPRATHVLPRHSSWMRGEGSRALRTFCRGIGINNKMTFHAFRATWATLLLQQGVSIAQIMAMGGWSDLKSIQIYIRLAGVDTQGATECLAVVPKPEARVLQFRQS